MLKSTSVALDEHLVGFIDRQIAEGRYGSAIEVVRAALGVAGRKRGEARGVAGEQSGPSEAFDFDAFIAARRSADR